MSPCADARTLVGASSNAIARNEPPTTIPMPNPTGIVAARNSHKPYPIIAAPPYPMASIANPISSRPFAPTRFKSLPAPIEPTIEHTTRGNSTNPACLTVTPYACVAMDVRNITLPIPTPAPVANTYTVANWRFASNNIGINGCCARRSIITSSTRSTATAPNNHGQSVTPTRRSNTRVIPSTKALKSENVTTTPVTSSGGWTPAD